MKRILIVRGDDTNFNDGNLFQIIINSDTSLEGYSGSLEIGSVLLNYPDVSSGVIIVNLTSSQTRQLIVGNIGGTFKLTDSKGRIKTIVTIPFEISDRIDPRCELSQEVSINLITVQLIHNSRDYNDLINIPQISGVPLQGDLTPEELNCETPASVNDKINSGVSEHNLSGVSHSDIRLLLNQNSKNITNILTTIQGINNQLNQLTHRITVLENKIND